MAEITREASLSTEIDCYVTPDDVLHYGLYYADDPSPFYRFCPFFSPAWTF